MTCNNVMTCAINFEGAENSKRGIALYSAIPCLLYFLMKCYGHYNDPNTPSKIIGDSVMFKVIHTVEPVFLYSFKTV